MRKISLQKTEFKRVIKFAESLGLRVRFIDAKKRDYHGCYIRPEKFEPGLIEVCRTKRTTFTFQIATLLHEVGHHLDFIKTQKLPDSYNLLDTENCPDWARVSIFNAEQRACKNAEKLFWTLRLRLPFWKIKMELSVDLFLYGVFKRTGGYPQEKEIRNFRKKWKRKFKEKYKNFAVPRIKPLN